MHKRLIGFSAAVLVTVGVTSTWAQQEVFHDAFLNWDFENFTGQVADDFEIIVESPTFDPFASGHFDGYFTPPAGFADRFPNFDVSQGDFDGDGDVDTKVSWSGAPVDPNQMIHVGLGMRDSGKILEAYWTLGGEKIEPSIAITYERTIVRPNGDLGDIGMLLNIAPGFFADDGQQAGWTGVRTFMDIPANMLGLEDINRQLDLADLEAFETQNECDTVVFDDNPIECFVGRSPNLSMAFESLLVADIVDQGEVIGRFWNLNPQSPEPGTLSMFFLGALMVWNFGRKNYGNRR
jgi:hypothetical protein